MTCLGVAVGSFLAFVLVGAWNRVPKFVMFGFVSLAISQVCFYLLWWTSLTQQPTLWRVWWVALVAAATVAPRAALVRPEKKPDWLWAGDGCVHFVNRAAAGGASRGPERAAGSKSSLSAGHRDSGHGSSAGFLVLWARPGQTAQTLLAVGEDVLANVAPVFGLLRRHLHWPYRRPDGKPVRTVALHPGASQLPRRLTVR